MPGAFKKGTIDAMVVIRLSRFGKRNAPYYRIAVADSRSKATGGVIEYVGTWNPIKKIKQVDTKKVAEWVGKGAKVSASVKKIIESK